MIALEIAINGKRLPEFELARSARSSPPNDDDIGNAAGERSQAQWSRLFLL